MCCLYESLGETKHALTWYTDYSRENLLSTYELEMAKANMNENKVASENTPFVELLSTIFNETAVAMQCGLQQSLAGCATACHQTSTSSTACPSD